MAVTFGNIELRNRFQSTALSITPPAGADYQIAAAVGAVDVEFTVTFGGDSMTLLLSRLNDTEGGLFNLSTRLHGRAGDYTGSARDVVWSGADKTRLAATFIGVDQTTPVLHSDVQRTIGGTTRSMTIGGASNPVGSRIVWLAFTLANMSGNITCDAGAVHGQLDNDGFGAIVGALGSIAGTGSEITFTVTVPDSTDILLFGVVLAEAGGGAPGVPTITAAGSAEDAVRAILSALPDDADDVEVYGSTTTGVDETDTLVGTLTAAGSVFWTERTPDTTYYLRPRATGPGGETFGDEVTATTFGGDFADKGVDEAVLTDTLSLLEGETATHVDVPLGLMIRATSGLGRDGTAVVVITDGDAETIGGDTLTGADLPNVDGGETHRMALSPNPTGPQTITVTATVSIDPA